MYWCSLQTVVILLLSTVSLCSATAIKCDADLTTKFAIGKRQMEKQLECRMNAENIAKCDDVIEVNKAWENFEKINDQYSEAIADCKTTQRSKRRRSIDCGCNRDKSESDKPNERVKRSCGCGLRHHRDQSEGKPGHINHHRHHQIFEDCIDSEEQMLNMRDRRLKRHRHRNAPELQKHERGKHSRAHVPHRHNHKWKATRKHGAHRRRHDHGSNDDRKEEEQVPDANDRSKSPFRIRRGSCILQGRHESDRLEAKYASLCDRSQICDKQNLHGDQKKAMNELSKKRQKIYREYLSIFDRCYGSAIHS